MTTRSPSRWVGGTKISRGGSAASGGSAQPASARATRTRNRTCDLRAVCPPRSPSPEGVEDQLVDARPARRAPRAAVAAARAGAAARHTNGARKSQMRSVSAFVKPTTAAIAITAKIATAASSPRASARSASHAIGSAEDEQERDRRAEQPEPVGPPRGDARAVDLLGRAQRADRVEAGGGAQHRVERDEHDAAHRRPARVAGASPSRASARIAAHAPTASSDHAKSDADGEHDRAGHARRPAASGHAASSPSVR